MIIYVYSDINYDYDNGNNDINENKCFFTFFRH